MADALPVLMACAAVIVLLLLCSGGLPWRSDEEVRQLYMEWKAKHGRTYHALGEDQRRFAVFEDNLRYIDEQNAAADRGEHTFRLGLTPFADLSSDEYRATYLGFRNLLEGGRSSWSAVSDRYLPSEDDDLPDYVDWRKMGAVAPIKNQGNCRSSWAFSAIAAVEGINQIDKGGFIVLSEQELLDCDTNFDKGCEGGRMDYAFEFIISNGGIDTEEDYPYRARAEHCDTYRKNAKVVSIDSYEDVPINNEHALQKAVANQPVSVAIDVSGRNFQHYQSGVFDGECGNDVNHGVVVVGYGREKEQDYWIVKNSWGDRWGEAGYARIRRNFAASSAGKCGIAVAPSYPVKKGSNPPPQPPPPPVKPPSSCGKFHSCPASTTCCCLYQFDDICLVPTCCPGEDAVCCNDGRSCCPQDYPVCDLMYGICVKSKNNRLGVKALKRIPAKPLFGDSVPQALKSSE